MVPGDIRKKNGDRETHREAACLEVSSGQKHLMASIYSWGCACMRWMDQDGMWVGDKEEMALLDQLGV